MTKSILVNDARFPGGSKEEVERDYEVSVTIFDDGSYEVQGEATNVDAFVEDYSIVVEEEQN